ncbi:AbrB/MazE/SpoVT family DNA-binding domain-containing protein [Nitriliruptor alkaliphilus]|uniref:AbrB/MazE/SpoVT family DNA-binding domain-containing protein n=1 Tax=Nitriliruptor alkaliphilus TaxID=427918 RepID=UPI000695EF53|nr:AbrB/MazE/SpoVT family DNA-binding domain-containing protein [Nitriliruptor alkaliphilus]
MVTAEVRLGTQGRLVLPREIRDELGAEEGTTYIARVEDGALILESREAVLARMQARLRAAVPPGVSLVDELLAERRSDAAREDAGR